MNELFGVLLFTCGAVNAWVGYKVASLKYERVAEACKLDLRFAKNLKKLKDAVAEVNK